MSDDNSFVVVRTASTPAEAKVLVALLQAEGIQALVDGDTLADEVAISRRVMNLNGVRVQVPALQLEAAKEILAESRVDDDELEAQALAAGPPPSVGQPAPLARGDTRWRVSLGVAVVTTPLTFVFFALWQGSAARIHAYEQSGSQGGRFRYERSKDGWRWIDTTTGRTRIDIADVDHDGFAEMTSWYDAAGNWLQSSIDADHDGIPEGGEEVRPDGTKLMWVNSPDRRILHLEVRAKDGTVLGRQHLGGSGFVDDR